MKNIIAIQGLKGSGKDEVAKFLRYLLGTPSWMHQYWMAKLLNFKPLRNKWVISRYASKLKEILSIIMNVDCNRFEDREFKEKYFFDFNNYKLMFIDNVPKDKLITDKKFCNLIKQNRLEEINKNYILSIRQILQFFGTEICRKFLGDNLWIHCTLNDKHQNVIIADQRFIVENNTLLNSDYNKFIIHVCRNLCQVGRHSSEQEVMELYRKKRYDYEMPNNGTLKDLFNNCKTASLFLFK